MTIISPAKPAATLSIDLDNLWCYQRSFGIESWNAYASFLEIALPRILKLLDQFELRLTVFIIGLDAGNKTLQPLFAEIAKRGHEIGNHSYNHSIGLPHLSQEHIVEELKQAEAAILTATGRKPLGFRGPAYTQSNTLLESLLILGYQYDASSLPNTVGILARFHHRSHAARIGKEADMRDSLYGNLKESRRALSPYLWELSGGTIMEMPITTMPL
jgi:peptidoglycan/xylan/chitin deacetylase (PgdA/CDA1 family)